MYMDIKIDGKQTLTEQVNFLETVKKVIEIWPHLNCKIDAWADGDCIYIAFNMDCIPEGNVEGLIEFKNNLGAHMDLIPTSRDGVNTIRVVIMLPVIPEDL